MTLIARLFLLVVTLFTVGLSKIAWAQSCPITKLVDTIGSSYPSFPQTGYPFPIMDAPAMFMDLKAGLQLRDLKAGAKIHRIDLVGFNDFPPFNLTPFGWEVHWWPSMAAALSGPPAISRYLVPIAKFSRQNYSYIGAFPVDYVVLNLVPPIVVPAGVAGQTVVALSSYGYPGQVGVAYLVESPMSAVGFYSDGSQTTTMPYSFWTVPALTVWGSDC